MYVKKVSPEIPSIQSAVEDALSRAEELNRREYPHYQVRQKKQHPHLASTIKHIASAAREGLSAAGEIAGHCIAAEAIPVVGERDRWYPMGVGTVQYTCISIWICGQTTH